MLWYKSIDKDGPFKQLVVEELVLEQIKFHTREGDDAWMGFPWCLQLLKIRLRAERRRASDAVLGSIIHAATALARDIVARRSSEVSRARSRETSVSREEATRGVTIVRWIDSLGEPFNPRLVTAQYRELLLRTCDEAMHQLRCLLALPGGAEMIEQLSNSLPSNSLSEDLKKFAAELDITTRRSDQYNFSTIE